MRRISSNSDMLSTEKIKIMANNDRFLVGAQKGIKAGDTRLLVLNNNIGSSLDLNETGNISAIMKNTAKEDLLAYC